MILTAQGQSLANLAFFHQGAENVAPEFDFPQHCTVANAEQTFLCTGQGYTDTIGDVQKASFPLRVTSNQRQQDNVILFSLVLVHHMDFDSSELVCRHDFAQALELASVGSEDGNLLWFVVLTEEVATKGNYKLCLVLVLMAFSIFDFFFKVIVPHKEQTGINTLEDSI